MAEKQRCDGLYDTTESLRARIKELEETLSESQVKEKAALKITYDVHGLNQKLLAENAALKARNQELEDPDGRHHSNGLGWLGKVVQIIRRVNRPLRSGEIMHELTVMDKYAELSMRADPEGYLSVVLSKGVKAKRLTIYKVPGTRGGYYALEEWIDKDGQLSDEMKHKLL